MSGPRDRAGSNDRTSPSKVARAVALEQIARTAYRGRIRLNLTAYEHLSRLGLNRAFTSAACDMLVRDGKATLGVDHDGVVVLTLTEPAA